jgi:hypothetical protein
LSRGELLERLCRGRLKTQRPHILRREYLYLSALEPAGRRRFALIREFILLQASACVQEPVEELFLSPKRLDVESLTRKSLGKRLCLQGQGLEIA